VISWSDPDGLSGAQGNAAHSSAADRTQLIPAPHHGGRTLERCIEERLSGESVAVSQ
jgi:hypothetical protein